MRSPITILDVARKAGVSKVTVSYVLNGQDAAARISAETKERVLAAAKDLGYRPNAIARMLVTKRSNAVAIVLQHAHFFAQWSAFTSEVMRGVCQASVEQGYDVMLHTRNVIDASGEVDALTDGRVDGVLLLRDNDDPTLLDLMRTGFPCVLFFTRSDSPDVPFVDCDNYSGGRMATRHLLELGHTKIGMVRGAPHSVSSNDRFNGFRDALETAKLKPQERWMVRMPTPTEGSVEFLHLMRQTDRPTAVFCWSDDAAIQCMRIVREIGLRVPQDISIVGFDSSDVCDHVTPALTSVKQPVLEMAREAALMLSKIARKQELPRKQVIYPLTLDVRSSTAPPPRSSPSH